MTFRNLRELPDALVASFHGSVPVTELPAGEYAKLRYPRFPAVMRFAVRRYAAAGFGNLFSMYTRAMGGLMQLATLVFTPNCGTDAPLLLIDVMAFGKKRAAFVEYYDLTATGAACPALEAVASQYGALPDYAEKPAWYVAARTPYSLIKGGSDDARLIAMLTDSVAAYGATCAARCEFRMENCAGLRSFVDRMVEQGNPASATLEKVLGKERAEAFFRTAVMPATYQTDTKEII